MSLLREYVNVPPEEELHPSQMKTVGEILDLIERIQEETDEAGRRVRSANVGIEFIKIAMGEIPLVGGALGAADGLFAMYQAGKNEEHTWAELEEYPILARMKMHPSLAKHLDPVTLKEIDKAYQGYLQGLGRETLVSEITDIDNFTHDWIMGDTDNKLSVELLREYVREQFLLEREEAEASLLSGVSDFIETRHYDDVLDAAFKRIAPGLVRHVMEQEINEDVAEFLDGAIEGRWEKQKGWSFEDPSPKQLGHSEDSADYILGYSWGWNNADSWEGNRLPTQARKEAVEAQIAEFEDQISEQMVIAALETANEKVNPVKLIKKAIGAIRSAVREEGLSGGLKKGLPIAIGIIVGEALDNFIIPMAFFSMTGIPIPPLPIGVGEIINPVVISMVGADIESDELVDELGWYEEEYGEASSLGPRETNELRAYIREALLTEYWPARTEGKKNVWRGMKIKMSPAILASKVRQYIKTGEEKGITQQELIRFLLGRLEGESTGASWSLSFDVAVSFADAWGATNRGAELHVIFQATVDEEAGYDPQAAGEEPGLFYDEAEVRFKPGAEIPLTGIYVFIKSKDQWAKQRTQFRPLMIKAEDNPMMVKA